MINMRGELPGKYFLRVSTQGLQYHGGSNWKQISVGNVTSFTHGTSFEGVEGSEGTAEVWQWESPEVAWTNCGYVFLVC